MSNLKDEADHALDAIFKLLNAVTKRKPAEAPKPTPPKEKK